MSIKLMSEAWDMNITMPQKIVLLCICDFSNDEGISWPSVSTIARKCGLQKRAVQYNISHLVEHGLIEIIPRFAVSKVQVTNVYRVLFAKLEDADICTLVEAGLLRREDAPSCMGRMHLDAPLKLNHHINHQETLLSGEEKKPTHSFQDFWGIYPRKDNKAMAKKIWDRSKYSDFTLDLIFKAIPLQKENGCLKDEKFIPHASTWLNQERWLDEVQDKLDFDFAGVR